MRTGTTNGLIVATLASVAWLALSGAAHAGCGCDKPPPPPAQVRPAVTYPGATVTLFAPGLVTGRVYDVIFRSGVSDAAASVSAVAISARDLADAKVKPQIRVELPELPLGPARIDVSYQGAAVLAVEDDAFTVAPQAVALPEEYGTYRWAGYRAAVGRDGVTYITLDMSGMQKPMVFDARAVGFPLRFAIDDVVFRNTQGFLMQLLVDDWAKNDQRGIPGMFVFPAAAGSTTSDALQYSRHEFATYFLSHYENQPHAVDPSDPWWHLDGTRHIDHDLLILAIDGTVGGKHPEPGATPAFDLVTGIYSLFNEGVVGRESIAMDDDASIDSYDSATGAIGQRGDVFSNGKVSVRESARILGSVRATAIQKDWTATITGSREILKQKQTFMAVKVPSEATYLGDVRVSPNSNVTVHGPGSFVVRNVTAAAGARIFVDNTAGPVTLYVTGSVKMQSGSRVTLADPEPERFAVYVSGVGPVEIAGSRHGETSFTGVLYAPDASVKLTGQGELEGAFVGRTLEMNDGSEVHYDESLRRPVE